MGIPLVKPARNHRRNFSLTLSLIIWNTLKVHLRRTVVIMNRIKPSRTRNSNFVGFVAFHPKSTAMVIAGRSVHLTTLFLGRLEQAVNQ